MEIAFAEIKERNGSSSSEGGALEEILQWVSALERNTSSERGALEGEIEDPTVDECARRDKS